VTKYYKGDQIEKDVVDTTCSTHGGDVFKLVNLKEIYHLEHVRINGRINLKYKS
jgi:hypothetical protein